MNDLSNILRPKTLNEFIGQKHIIGNNCALYKLIKKEKFPIFFSTENQEQEKQLLQKLLQKR